MATPSNVGLKWLRKTRTAGRGEFYEGELVAPGLTGRAHVVIHHTPDPARYALQVTHLNETIALEANAGAGARVSVRDADGNRTVRTRYHHQLLSLAAQKTLELARAELKELEEKRAGGKTRLRLPFKPPSQPRLPGFTKFLKAERAKQEQKIRDRKNIIRVLEKCAGLAKKLTTTPLA